MTSKEFIYWLKGFIDYQQLQEQKAQNAAAQLVNDRLSAELHDLKDGLEMVEERARAEIGMVKPNEIFVQIAK